jgi:hypothetical protein
MMPSCDQIGVPVHFLRLAQVLELLEWTPFLADQAQTDFRRATDFDIISVILVDDKRGTLPSYNG